MKVGWTGGSDSTYRSPAGVAGRHARPPFPAGPEPQWPNGDVIGSSRAERSEGGVPCCTNTSAVEGYAHASRPHTPAQYHFKSMTRSVRHLLLCPSINSDHEPFDLSVWVLYGCLSQPFPCSRTASPKPFGRMKYQAVARSANGTPWPIRPSPPVGHWLRHRFFAYQETQTVTTNAMGLFTVEGAMHTHPYQPPVRRDPWGQNTWWTFVVEMDPAGGTNYTMVGSEPILAAPMHTMRTRLVCWATVPGRGLAHARIHRPPGRDRYRRTFRVIGSERNAKVSSLFVGDGVFHDGTGP